MKSLGNYIWKEHDSSGSLDLVEQILQNREILSKEDKELYLKPSFENHLHDLQAQHESDDKHEAVIAHRKGAYFEDFHIRIPINAGKDHTLVLLVNVKKSLQSAREFLFEILFFFRYRIISRASPGMTFGNPFNCQPSPLEQAMLIEGFNRVMRAGRRKSATGRGVG